MLSYAHGASDVPLLGETISRNLDRTAEGVPDAEALVSRHQGIRWTYAELAAEVDRMARALIAIGLEPGERLGMWSPNCAEWVVIQYATAKARVVLVNINPAYRTSELEYALAQSGCRALVAASSFKTSDYAAMIEEVRGGLPALERVFLLGSPDWEELLASADRVSTAELRERADALQFDDPINIQYTSGTTGSPCPVEVMRRVVSEMHMEEVTICYGMTETSPVSTQTAPGDSLERRVSTVGRVHPHVEIKVLDPATGRVVPRGGTGELCTR